MENIMQLYRLGINDVVNVLDGLREEGGQRPHLVFSYDDPRLDWSALGCCSNQGYPGLDKGQRGDCRWSVHGQRSLHAHWHDDRVEFHIDQQDPVRNPIGHLLFDTPAGAFALIGAVGVGLATGSAGKALLGALGGVGVGLAMDRGATTRWLLAANSEDGGWQAQRLTALA